MKIAIPTRQNEVDDHFGHCDHYTIVTIEDQKVINTQALPSPQGCGCKSNIAATLHSMGVEVMLAGSMGQGAYNVLQGQQIKVIRGCSGSVESLIEKYLKGSITDSAEQCAHHEHGEHQCPNH
ncbi:MAG: NifB/NifX family molybdenum-iron cluster-binding protein [Mucinivorans sp.]